MIHSPLHVQAAAWANIDPDPGTAGQINRALEHDDTEALDAWFGRRLDFGTAGLRGPVGPGPNRMNKLLVRQTAAGFGRWLGEAPVIVAYDGRADSAQFAREAVRALAGAGCEVALFNEPIPTPLLSFAVERLEAGGGMMITASHNPPADNGIKLFGSEGAQLLPEQEVEVATQINKVLMNGGGPPLVGEDDPGIASVGPGIRSAYVSSVVGHCRTGHRDVSVVHTSLHGVAGPHVIDAFESAGFDAPIEVPEQACVDPAFPTVSRPNPEESEAMSMAVGLAVEVGADVVLANDPDGDRLAVAIPELGEWRALTGTEIAALLVDHLFSATSGSARMVVGTITGTRLLQRQAEAAGVGYVDSPPGFKWLTRPGLEQSERRCVFAFEEAMGFLVGRTPRDKDGISAAVVMAETVARLKADGRTPAERLAEIANEHGLTHVDPLLIRIENTADPTGALEQVMNDLRERLSGAFGDAEIVESRDLLVDVCTAPIDAVLVTLDDGCRLVIRPSGTEPVLKFHVEVTAPVDGGVEEAKQARLTAGEIARRHKRAFAQLLT